MIRYEFKKKVWRELIDARNRALATLTSEEELKKFRRIKHLCVQCGIPYDEQTPGCERCIARHIEREEIEKREGLCHFCQRKAPIVDGLLRCVRCGHGKRWYFDELDKRKK